MIMTKEFENLLVEVKALDFTEGEWAIYGSGPMAVRDIRQSNDLDIVVFDSLYQPRGGNYQSRNY